MPGAVQPNRIVRVLGTRRPVPASRLGSGGNPPVEAYRPATRPCCHAHSWSPGASRACTRPSAPARLASSSPLSSLTAAGVARTRYAAPLTSRSSWARIEALSRRRRRFRTTAVPTSRPMAYATLGGPEEPGAQLTPIVPIRALVAPRPSRENVARSRIRQIKPTGARGPSGAARGAQRDLHASSFANGSRAYAYGADCWVGTCASQRQASSRRHLRGTEQGAARGIPRTGGVYGVRWMTAKQQRGVGGLRPGSLRVPARRGSVPGGNPLPAWPVESFPRGC